ncbi:MAG: hypothetical protein U5L46_16315 [Agrobacterium sp.]|nr:hypothetical protein [Agrobacterium sp.]
MADVHPCSVQSLRIGVPDPGVGLSSASAAYDPGHHHFESGVEAGMSNGFAASAWQGF